MNNKSWNDFADVIKNDLTKLNDRKKDLDTIKEKAQLFSSILENVESVLDNKDKVLEEDSSLSESFKKLEFFKERNNLSNLMAKEAFNEIINSSILRGLIDVPITLNAEIDSINAQIERINGLINGSIETSLVIELAKSHGFNDESIKDLLYYPLLERTFTVSKTVEEELPLETKNKEVEEETVVPTIPVLDKVEKEELTNDELSSEDIGVQNAMDLFEGLKKESEEYFKPENETVTRYQILKQEISNTIDYNRRFLEEQYALSQKINEMYAPYTNYSIDEIETLVQDKEEVKKIIAKKMFIAQEETSKLLDDLERTLITSNDKDDIEIAYELVNEKMEEYLDCFDRLKSLNVVKSEEPKDKDVKVFFAHDVENNPLFNTNDENVKRAQSIINKFDGVQTIELDVNTNLLKGAENVVRVLRKKLYITSGVPKAIYLKVNYNNKPAAYVLTISNPENMLSSVNRIVRNRFSDIMYQTLLIEQNDPNEMQIQTYIRDLLVGPTSSMTLGGKDDE